MTIICALNSGGRTYLGADTAAFNNGTQVNGVRKFVLAHGWAVGSAGNLRSLNLLRHHATFLLRDLETPHEFTLRFKRVLGDDGWNYDDEPGPKGNNQQIILANPSCVWSICPGLSYVKIPEGDLWSDGSGRAFALGAGNLAEDTRHPDERIEAAVWAAIRYDQSCVGKFWTGTLAP